jgi:serine/threonine protein kinase
VYLVLPYCSGGDLHSRITREYGGRLPEHVARRFFLQILEGVEEMQRQGVVHR